jgi:DNA-dependent RNA polymerase
LARAAWPRDAEAEAVGLEYGEVENATTTFTPTYFPAAATNEGVGASRYARAFFSQQEKAIDKEKSANGVAPNCVRACDAAHLLLVANAAAVEGVRQIATVHDSFGCLASHARRFNQVILEQFALMDETHGVLAELLEQASHDLTPSNQNRLFSRELRPRHDHPGQGADFRRRGAALR